MKKSVIVLICLIALTCKEKEDVVRTKTRKLEGTFSYYELKSMDDYFEKPPKAGLWGEHPLGRWHYFFGDSTLADSLIREDITLNERFGESGVIGGTFGMDYLILGLNSIRLGDIDSCSKYIMLAEKEFEELEFNRGLMRCHYARALAHKSQKEFDKALVELGEALNIGEHDSYVFRIKKEIGDILEVTGGEFQGKNCYDWWTENH